MPVRAWWGRRSAAVCTRDVLVVAVALLPVASSARAQWNGQISIANDERWRGRSLSDGRPAATLSLGYDDRSGAYADAAATVAALPRGLDVVAVAVDAGYAWRSSGGRVIDLGVTRRAFRGTSAMPRDAGYTEVYAGLSGRSLSARLFYSPDYLQRGASSVYASLDGVVRPARAWRLLAHVGAMRFVGTLPRYVTERAHVDYSLGVARRIGRIDAQLAWTGGAPGSDFYRGRAHARRALTLAISLGL